MKIFHIFIILVAATTANADSTLGEMSINSKCEAWKSRASDLVFEYFSGVTKEEQYQKIDVVTENDKETNLTMKRQVDGVYEHIPFVQDIKMRNYYQEGYAQSVYKLCVDRYINAKP